MGRSSPAEKEVPVDPNFYVQKMHQGLRHGLNTKRESTEHLSHWWEGIGGGGRSSRYFVEDEDAFRWSTLEKPPTCNQIGINFKDVHEIRQTLSQLLDGMHLEEKFEAAGVWYKHRLTDDMVAYALKSDGVINIKYILEPAANIYYTFTPDVVLLLSIYESSKSNYSSKKSVKAGRTVGGNELSKFSDTPGDASLDDLFQPNDKLDDRPAEASTSASSSHVNQGNAFVTDSGKTDLATQLQIVYQGLIWVSLGTEMGVEFGTEMGAEMGGSLSSAGIPRHSPGCVIVSILQIPRGT
ncbi:MAP3K epsilon protein kinase 1 [Artemisia annua]|uniref:MAP3K epsilon protein kinase 1 n=1 Tax=Artemisia annua TaxID=35608 RepID=A0A2U1P839_ARTAN|nr:MAP3K epsilon protein kinase 1 [Artemisia annua]